MGLITNIEKRVYGRCKMNNKPIVFKIISITMIIMGILGAMSTLSIKMYYHLLTFRVDVALSNIKNYLLIVSIVLFFLGIALLKAYKWSRYSYVFFIVIKSAVNYYLIGFDVSLLPFLLLEMVIIALLFTGNIDLFFENTETKSIVDKIGESYHGSKKRVTLIKAIRITFGICLVALFALLQVIVVLVLGAIVFIGLNFTEALLLKALLVFIVAVFLGMTLLAGLLVGFEYYNIALLGAFSSNTILLGIGSMISLALPYSNFIEKAMRSEIEEYFISSVPNLIIGTIIYFILSTVSYRIYKKKEIEI